MRPRAGPSTPFCRWPLTCMAALMLPVNPPVFPTPCVDERDPRQVSLIPEGPTPVDGVTSGCHGRAWHGRIKTDTTPDPVRR
jgi:hypothetical protein